MSPINRVTLKQFTPIARCYRTTTTIILHQWQMNHRCIFVGRKTLLHDFNNVSPKIQPLAVHCHQNSKREICLQLEPKKKHSQQIHLHIVTLSTLDVL